MVEKRITNLTSDLENQLDILRNDSLGNVTSVNVTQTIHDMTTVASIRTRKDSIGWIISQIFTSLFIVVSLYLTTAILFHKYTVWKKKRLLNGNHFASNSTINVVFSNNNNSKNQVRRLSPPNSTRVSPLHSISHIHTGLESLIVLAAVFVTLRVGSEELVLFLSDIDSDTCNILADVSVIFYACPIAAIYAFLWLRQRIFYHRPPLSLFNSPTVRIISVTIIVVMIIGEIATTLVFTLTISYKPGYLGCEALKDETLLPEWVPWFMIITFTVIFQVLLLSLYIGPLIHSRIKTRKTNELRRHGSDGLRRTIQRVCIITCACVLSDLIAVLVTIRVKHIGIVSNLVYDLNLIVNLVGIVCSFSDWKQRLFPFWNSCGKKHSDTSINSESGRYSSSNGDINV